MTTKLRSSSRQMRGKAADRINQNNGKSNPKSAHSKLNQDKQKLSSTKDTNEPVATFRDLFAIETDVTKSEKLVTRPAHLSWLRWFNNLSVGRKQLTGLVISEIISVLGLVGAGSFLIVMGGRSQLLHQARSELFVTDIAYNIKVDQMGLGFRGQSDNSAIIEVATDYAAGEVLPEESLTAVNQILQNEIEARNIEYATLVGSDLKIIANANRDRRGETFDPEGLVGTVLQNPRQIKTSAIVPWADLQQEQPPLPPDFADQDALIRYTLTPVKASNTDQVVGVLVSGDIINGKTSIPQDTLSTFENGYSAIYQRQEDGSFTLTTSLNAGDNPDIQAATPDISLNHSTLLEQAIAQPDRTVSRRDQVGDRTYTLAAKAIENFNGEPVAVLVRGASETPVNRFIANSLKLQLLVASLALVINVLLAKFLGRSILYPLQNLQRAAWTFGSGKREARADIFAADEVGRVARVFNQLADNITKSEKVLQQQAQREKQRASYVSLVADLTTRIRQSLDEPTILTALVEGLREVLEVDRVLIYQFHHDYKAGDIIAESVGSGWKSAVGTTIIDPLTPEVLEHYHSGRVTFMEDRTRANIAQCHCAILENLEVQANLVAPLFTSNQLIGLICAHQCDSPRQWQSVEIDLMQQVSSQSGYALNQARSLQRQQLSTLREQQLTEIISRMRQSLNEAQIHRAAVDETRRVLSTDRVLVYWFDPTWKGTFVAESVESGWPTALGDDIYDPCFADTYVEQYQQGRIHVIPNVAKADLTECHLKQLAPYQVQASLVAPIVVEDKLVGLFITHQCSKPRNWNNIDINFFKQVASQLSFALEQARLFAQTCALSEERLDRQQTLQTQLVQLLSDVEGAARGDLTVRADVTAGEIGTVADFFNAVVESLRRIVTQVKQSAEQVNVAIGENEGAVQTLADDACKQAEEVVETLTALEYMNLSLQQVAESAQQAATIANNASSRAENSGESMDLTVQNILNLRDIIGETSKKVKRLGESSQEISKVISLINQIATQTHLLAINAGIEAIRAGEEGQGFAVVAEEVSELASRSAAATHSIEHIVATIQQETAEVVEAMERSTAEVVAGTHFVENAKQNLSRIVEVSLQIDLLVQSVSQATVSQAEVSGTVTKLMQDIAHVSERTSESSRQISNSLQQTIEVSQSLQESVGAFKTKG